MARWWWWQRWWQRWWLQKEMREWNLKVIIWASHLQEGKLLTYKNLQIQPQDIASLVVKQPFGPRQKELLHSQKFFSCSESTCVLTFISEREAQAHMDSGKHIKELKSVSLYDTIRLRWAERVTGISNVAQEASAVFAHEKSASLKTKASSMGWALKVVLWSNFYPLIF